MNRFASLFPGVKPVIAMLHLKSDAKMDMMTRARQEIRAYYDHGVDAVLVENYFGSEDDCAQALAYLQQEYPDRLYGVNILGDWRRAFELAVQYGASFIQIDSVCGHLPPTQDAKYAQALDAMRQENPVAVLGGVRFKYQAVRSGRTLAEDLMLGMQRCDAIVVTGEGTGLPTPPEKLYTFRRIVGDFPLIAGAGVTVDSIAATMRDAEGAIIGSWFKEAHSASGDVVAEYVQEIVAGANRGRQES